MKTITGNNGYSHLGIVFEEHEGLIEYFFPVYILHQAKFYLLINSTVSFFSFAIVWRCDRCGLNQFLLMTKTR